MKCSHCGVDLEGKTYWWLPSGEPACPQCFEHEVRARLPWLVSGEDAVSVAIRAGVAPEDEDTKVVTLKPEASPLCDRLRCECCGYDLEAYRKEWEASGLKFVVCGDCGSRAFLTEAARRHDAGLPLMDKAVMHEWLRRRIENPSPGGKTAWPDAGGGEPKDSPPPLNCDCGATAVRGETHAQWCSSRRGT